MQNGFVLKNESPLSTKEMIEMGIFKIFRYFSKEWKTGDK